MTIIKSLRPKITSPNDLLKFSTSNSKQELLQFITNLSNSVSGLTFNSNILQNPIIDELLNISCTFKTLITQHPPIDQQKTRFGNVAFQSWHNNIHELLPSLLSRILTTPLQQSHLSELSEYLLHSFGNIQRIDYGTGHETHFIIFLLCLEKLNIITPEDYPSLVLRVFWDYIQLMRKLQFTYWLEPAGSHGVWGLDDYHFLPFLFGASQLSTHKYLTPKCIHNAEILQEFSKDYMYLSCVLFVNNVKSASLRWHSPMLDDISSAKSWDKISKGMFKMYEAEVLGKLPIMQHMLFGDLFSFEGTGELVENGQECSDGHVHHVKEFPTCCGIRVPSAMAEAIDKEKKEMRKVLPFD